MCLVFLHSGFQKVQLITMLLSMLLPFFNSIFFLEIFCKLTMVRYNLDFLRIGFYSANKEKLGVRVTCLASWKQRIPMANSCIEFLTDLEMKHGREPVIVFLAAMQGCSYLKSRGIPESHREMQHYGNHPTLLRNKTHI